jgi:hypothetical protein
MDKNLFRFFERKPSFVRAIAHAVRILKGFLSITPDAIGGY